MSLAGVVQQAIGSIIERDLNALRREVEAYADERDLWRTAPGTANSAGTLVLHLTGNLQHFFGACLGHTGYVRNRAAEFSRRDLPRAELLREIEAAREALKTGLARVSPGDLEGEFPELVADARLTTGEYLVHLATHLAYHLGQVDYHRRVITGNSTVVGAVRPVELSSARPSSPHP